MMTQQNNQNPSGVKGNAKSSSRTSSGGKFSTQQGIFNRHPVTACNTRGKMKIATWKVRTMYQAGKQENIVLETKRMGIDIMGLAEVRWLQSGKIVCNDHTLIFFRSQERSQTWRMFATQQSGLYVSVRVLHSV